MMPVDATLMRVLYDPSGWADQAWPVHFGIDSRWPPRLRNSLLLRRARVRGVTRGELVFPCSAWLAAHWEVLPAVVYLAGARLARNALLHGNGLMRLHHGAQRFVALPLSPSLRIGAWARPLAYAASSLDVHEHAWAAGLQCLRGAWREMPPGWLDRVRLRLPPQADMDSAMPGLSGETASAPPVEANYLRLLNYATAFHHAQNN